MTQVTKTASIKEQTSLMAKLEFRKVTIEKLGKTWDTGTEHIFTDKMVKNFPVTTRAGKVCGWNAEAMKLVMAFHGGFGFGLVLC